MRVRLLRGTEVLAVAQLGPSRAELAMVNSTFVIDAGLGMTSLKPFWSMAMKLLTFWTSFSLRRRQIGSLHVAQSPDNYMLDRCDEPLPWLTTNGRPFGRLYLANHERYVTCSHERTAPSRSCSTANIWGRH